jgi:hypothetical protein
MKDDPSSIQNSPTNANAAPSSAFRGIQPRPVARGGFRARSRLVCPYCGTPEASATNLWRHKAACPKNPNPTCTYCARHYTDAELARHEQRCESRPDAKADAMPEAETNAPTKPATVPAEDEPEEPAEEPAAKPPKIVSPRRELPASVPMPPPAAPEQVPLDPILASVAIHAAEINALGESSRSDAKTPGASLGGALSTVAASFTPAQADALRLMLHMKRQQDLRDTRDAIWGTLIVVGVVVGILLLLAHLDKPAKPAQTAPASKPAAPQTRPPYNPALHGSLEAYRAVYGHLPAPPVSLRDETPPGVGLDRSGNL